MKKTSAKIDSIATHEDENYSSFTHQENQEDFLNIRALDNLEFEIPTEKAEVHSGDAWSITEEGFQRIQPSQQDRAATPPYEREIGTGADGCDVNEMCQVTGGIGIDHSEKPRWTTKCTSDDNVVAQTFIPNLYNCSRLLDDIDVINFENSSDGCLRESYVRAHEEKTNNQEIDVQKQLLSMKEPHLLQAIHNVDHQEEDIWSICTDQITYTVDENLPGKIRGEPRTKEQRKEKTKPKTKLFNADNCNKPIEDKKYEDVRYEDVIIQTDDKYNINRDISATYLGSTKSAKFEESLDENEYARIGKFSINHLSKTTMNFPQFSGVRADTLVDSGATKSIVSLGFLERNSEFNTVPRYKIPRRDLYVGNGTALKIEECIKITGEIGGHWFEIIALVIPIRNDKVLDFIFGAKSLFELQAKVDYQKLEVTFPLRTTQMRLTTPLTIPPRDSMEATFIIDDEPPHLSSGQVCVKLQIQRRDKTRQTCIFEMIKNNKKNRFEIKGILHNETDDMMQLDTKSIGAVDLRSMGYMTLSQETLRKALEDKTEFLTGDETTQFMHHALMAHKMIATENTNQAEGEDPYPWLDEDDERRTMTDEEILRKNVNLDEAQLTPEEKEKFRLLMIKYRNAFSLRDEMGCCPDMKIDLEMNDTTPFFIRPFAVKEEHKKLVDQEMRKGVLLGILRQGMSSYSSPVMLIPRKNQKRLRIITDFRVLNSRLVKLNPSIPLVRDAIQQLGASGCEIISLVDLKDAYHSIRIKKDSQKYCGITPYMGSPTYIYQRLGMGLTVSPAIWGNFINRVLEDLPNREHHLAIMDDCLVHSKKADHQYEIELLFIALIKNGLRMSPKKCLFFRIKLTYMGHTIIIIDNHPHITALKTHADAIRKLDPPKTPKQTKSFLGMVNFLGHYCKDLQLLLTPIYELTKKKVPFIWTEKHQEAFEKIKTLLSNPPILAMPTKDGKFIMDSDTCKYGCGAALHQIQSEKLRLVAYYSKKLPPVCKNYGITELELYGLTCNIVAFKHCLLHAEFEVYVDHTAIKFLVVAKTEPATPRIQRLLEVLSRYNFKLGYKPGKNMILADFFSRNPQKDNEPEDRIIPVVFDEVPEEYQTSAKMEKVKWIKDNAEHLRHNYDTRANRRRQEEERTREEPEVQKDREPTVQIEQEARKEPNIPEFEQPEETTKINQPETEYWDEPTGIDISAYKLPYIPDNPGWRKEHNEPRRAAAAKLPGQIKATTLEEILNPMPVDITLQGGIPDVNVTDELPDMKIPPLNADKEWKQLTNSKRIEVVRRVMPKQRDMKPLLKDIAKTVLHTYSLPIKMIELIAAYARSPYFKDIYKYVTRSYCTFTGKARTLFMAQCSDYVTLDRVLFHIEQISQDPTDIRLTMCVPEEYIALVLHQYHDLVLAAHQGISRTYATVRLRYFFPRMMHYIRTYIDSCHKCQEWKSHTAVYPAKSHVKIPMNYRPFDVCTLDVKHMPMSNEGWKFLLLCVCEFTCQTEYACIQNEKMETLYRAIFNKIVCRYGAPRVFVSDKHASFTSDLAQFFYKKLRIQPYTVNPYNKGSNKTERYIQTISVELKKFLTATGADWPWYVGPCVFALNTFVSPITGLSPYNMVFGRNNPTMSEIQAEIDTTLIPTDHYAKRLGMQIDKITEVQRDSSLAKQEARVWRELRAVPEPTTFAKGDLVMIKRPGLGEVSAACNFVTPWVGPLKIVGILGPDKYVISDLTGRAVNVVVGTKELKNYKMQVTSGLETGRVVEGAENAAKLLDSIAKAQKVKMALKPREQDAKT